MIEAIKDILILVGCWIAIMLLAAGIGKFAGMFSRYKDIK